MTTKLAESSSIAASSTLVTRTGRRPRRCLACSTPNPPKITFVNVRFIARHMKIERRKPDEPSRAPAMIRIGFASANPSAAPLNPAKEFSNEITTGMSAPPMRITIITPNASPIATSHGSSETSDGSTARTITIATPAASTSPFTTFCAR